MPILCLTAVLGVYLSTHNTSSTTWCRFVTPVDELDFDNVSLGLFLDLLDWVPFANSPKPSNDEEIQLLDFCK